MSLDGVSGTAMLKGQLKRDLLNERAIWDNDSMLNFYINVDNRMDFSIT